MNHFVATRKGYDSVSRKSWEAKCGAVVDNWMHIWPVYLPWHVTCETCLVLAALESEEKDGRT